MPKRTSSGELPAKSSAAPNKTKANKTRKRPDSTRLGRALIAGAEQILAHVRGEIELESYLLPGLVNVKAIREKTGLSQAQFARRFALSPRTLQQWEQGKQAPDSAVRAYLTVIDRNPTAVVEALRG